MRSDSKRHDPCALAHALGHSARVRMATAAAGDAAAAAAATSAASATVPATTTSDKPAFETRAALLQYGASASFDDKVAFLTAQLAALEHVDEWKLAVKRELAKSEYSVEQLQSVRSLSLLDNPLLYCVLEKMGLVSSLKRMVIDLHCAASQAVVAAASTKPTKHDDALFVPDAHSTHGCSLEVVLRARESWEAITRDEMLRFASESGRPLVTARNDAAPSAAQSALVDDSPSESVEDDQQLTKPRKSGGARFLYDGYVHAAAAAVQLAMTD